MPPRWMVVAAFICVCLFTDTSAWFFWPIVILASLCMGLYQVAVIRKERATQENPDGPR